jgi:hypothetical protein
MTLRTCSHEAEIKRLLQLGHWPQSCTPELRAHVDDCRACGDLVLVTEAFRNARAASMHAAQLPPPGVLWWRAQLRRRNEAVQRINKPILGAQIFALAVTLLIAVGFLAWQVRDGWNWMKWLASLAQSQVFHWEVLWPFASAKSVAGFLSLIPALVLLALVSGVVLYLGSEKHNS